MFNTNTTKCKRFQKPKGRERERTRERVNSELLTCSDKFIRTTLCPENLPKATIKLVFPTPGLPSNKTGNQMPI